MFPNHEFCESFDDILHLLQETSSGDFFKSSDEKLASKHIEISKQIYDLIAKLDDGDKSCPTRLFIENLDAEQIWQQIDLGYHSWPKVLNKLGKELRPKKKKSEKEQSLKSVDESNDTENKLEENDEVMKKIMKKVRFAPDVKQNSVEEEEFGGTNCDDEDEDDTHNSALESEKDGEGDDDDDDDDLERKPKRGRFELEKSDESYGALEMLKNSLGKSGDEEKTNKTNINNAKKLIVDDQFFQLSEMNAFLAQQDAMEEKESGTYKDSYADYDIDDENIDDDDNEGVNIKYDEFYDGPGEEEDGADEEDSVSTNKAQRELVPGVDKKNISSFERRQEVLNKRISLLEDKAIESKPWQLTGEVAGLNRPMNSLMGEQLDYETTSKPAMLITEETTKTIEEKIIQRLISNVWDGPKRKIKTNDGDFVFKKKVVADPEKSKLSLAEIYEKEFEKQFEKKEEKLPAEKEGIQKSMTSLFRKLDGLTNFDFYPKLAVPDVEIIPNAPAVTMEEVAPVAMSEAMMLAPEEILEKSKRGLSGATELTKTDKKRALRLKKKKQHFKRIDKENKEKVKKLKAEKRTMHKSLTDTHQKDDKVKKKSNRKVNKKKH